MLSDITNAAGKAILPEIVQGFWSHDRSSYLQWPQYERHADWSAWRKKFRD